MAKVTRKALVLELCECIWENRKGATATFRTMTLCSPSWGGHSGDRRLRELRESGIVKFTARKATDSDQFIYTVKPGPAHPLYEKQEDLFI